MIETNATRFRFETTFSKLLAAVRPTFYEVSLTPDLDKLLSLHEQGVVNFKGQVTIHVEFVRATCTLTLNADGLEIEAANALLDHVAAREVLRGNRTVTLVFPAVFPAGHHVLEIAYAGSFSAMPQGLYYSDYSIGSGQNARAQRIVVTQFEATDARRMVPCWDEPMFKARFKLSVDLPPHYQAVSNTPGSATRSGNSEPNHWSFDTTPNMSSYLLVLVAGELARLTDGGISARVGVDVGVFAPVGREHQGKYALEVLELLIPYYNDFFGVKYPLPKLDLIAIPDFVYTAMENWGGITYIDNVVLIDEANSPQKTRESVFETVAHELAHQWSGNLVTMAWWDDLWLNERFATWMHKKATDRFNGSWRFRLRAHEDKQSAMALDALATSRQIRHEIMDDTDADGAFDHITYRKGAALIRMLEDYLGEDVFRDGMRLYMKRHQYSNSTTSDLWGALADQSGKDVETIASAFVTQPGIPLVKVEQRTMCGKLLVVVKQEPFSIHGPVTDGREWRVPVKAALVGSHDSQAIVLGARPETLVFESNGEPAKVNFGEVGYYRTQYDPATFSLLSARFGRLEAADRVGLLADTWAMVQAGYYEPEWCFDLLVRAVTTQDLALWTQIIAILREVDDLERGSEGRNTCRAFACRLLQPTFAKLTWDASPDEAATAPLNPQLRSILVMALGRFGDAAIIAEARRRFALGAQAIDKELREAVATVVGYAADLDIFEELRRRGMEAESTEIRLMYYYALSGAGAPELIDRMLEIALGRELPIGRIDRFLVSAASTGDNPDRVWEAVLRRREDLAKKLSDLQNQRALALVATASSNPKVADQLEALPAGSPGALYQSKRAVEQIRFKAAFKERLVPKLEAWLKRVEA